MTTESSKLVVAYPCADSSAEQSFNNGMVGCAGNASWDNRRYLCGANYRPATAAEWVAYRGTGATSIPTHDYWTDDDLHHGGTVSSCSASLTAPDACPPGVTMHVCTTSGTDAEGNTCNWKNCGYNATSPNQYFGGCTGRTAGTLCIPEGCADGTIDQFFPNGMVGCAGAAGAVDAFTLCAPGYRIATIDEFNTLTRPEIRVPNTVLPTQAYWTASTRACPPAGCTGSTAGALCVPHRGCADGSAEQVMPDGFVGCSGTVPWNQRANLCARGYRVATSAEWVLLNQLGPAITPAYDYWTDDNLGYLRLPGCTATPIAGFACTGGPMRLCTASGTDIAGNTCSSMSNCGYGASPTPNLHFGGCNTNAAGTLCVPQDIAASDIVHQDPTILSMVNSAHAMFASPGLAAAIVVEGKIYLAAAGKRDVNDPGDDLLDTDRFLLDSVSKAISGMVATRAVDQGALSWSSTLGGVLPSVFQGSGSPPDTEYMGVTLAELNAHASGFDYDSTAHSGCPGGPPCEMNPPADAGNDYTATSSITDRKLLFTRDYVRDTHLFPHGAGWVYGTGAVPAISMLEQTTNQTPYDSALVKDYVFRPLGMKHSGTVTDVSGHSLTRDANGNPILQSSGPTDFTGQLRLPVGGMTASIEDIARFLHASIYSPQAPWRFWSYGTQQSLLNSVGQSNWSAAGWYVSVSNDAGGLQFWHNGCCTGSKSDVRVWPMRHIAIAVLTNYHEGGTAPALDWLVSQLQQDSVLSAYGVPPKAFPYPEAHSLHASAVDACPTRSGPTACTTSVYGAPAPDYDASKAFDGDYNTRWAAGSGVTSATLQVTLPSAKRVGHVVINEGGSFNAASGALSRFGPPDHVAEFRVTSWQLFLTNNGTEIMAASGTTLGANKLITVGGYGSVTKARLVMTSTDGPTITEMQLLPW